jgi:hypothetical protein
MAWKHEALRDPLICVQNRRVQDSGPTTDRNVGPSNSWRRPSQQPRASGSALRIIGPKQTERHGRSPLTQRSADHPNQERGQSLNRPSIPNRNKLIHPKRTNTQTHHDYLVGQCPSAPGRDRSQASDVTHWELRQASQRRWAVSLGTG